MPQTQWALDVLAQEGFKYDSSVYPISGSRYGWPGSSKDICKINLPSGNSIIEVPLSTVTVFGKTFPAAGGGYLRHFPYAITKTAIKKIQNQRPAIVYMHPYEIDIKNQPLETQSLSPKQRAKAMRFHRMQMRNRHTVAKKLIRLLTDFQFTTAAEVIETQLAQ